jgi:hypothetical protein
MGLLDWEAGCKLGVVQGLGVPKPPQPDTLPCHEHLCEMNADTTHCHTTSMCLLCDGGCIQSVGLSLHLNCCQASWAVVTALLLLTGCVDKKTHNFSPPAPNPMRVPPLESLVQEALSGALEILKRLFSAPNNGIQRQTCHPGLTVQNFSASCLHLDTRQG